MAIDLKNIKDEDLIQLYPDLISELKQRGIIRTNNIVGELGEYFAVKIFNDNSNLPKLQKPSQVQKMLTLIVQKVRDTLLNPLHQGKQVFFIVNLYIILIHPVLSIYWLLLGTKIIKLSI